MTATKKANIYIAGHLEIVVSGILWVLQTQDEVINVVPTQDELELSGF